MKEQTDSLLKTVQNEADKISEVEVNDHIFFRNFQNNHVYY